MASLDENITAAQQTSSMLTENLIAAWCSARDTKRFEDRTRQENALSAHLVHCLEAARKLKAMLFDLC